MDSPKDMAPYAISIGSGTLLLCCAPAWMSRQARWIGFSSCRTRPPEFWNTRSTAEIASWVARTWSRRALALISTGMSFSSRASASMSSRSCLSWSRAPSSSPAASATLAWVNGSSATREPRVMRTRSAVQGALSRAEQRRSDPEGEDWPEGQPVDGRVAGHAAGPVVMSPVLGHERIGDHDVVAARAAQADDTPDVVDDVVRARYQEAEPPDI